jgi:hypothetical protein
MTTMNEVMRHHGASIAAPAQRDSLVDVLERVLDKGVVVAGDIKINLLDIELLTIKVRLLITSVDKAREIGIDWWTRDPALTSHKQQDQQKGIGKGKDNGSETKALMERLERIESQLQALTDGKVMNGSGSRGGGGAGARRK